MAVPVKYIFRINNIYAISAADNTEIANDTLAKLSWSKVIQTSNRTFEYI